MQQIGFENILYQAKPKVNKEEFSNKDKEGEQQAEMMELCW